jgi:poly(A) polymerase
MEEPKLAADADAVGALAALERAAACAESGRADLAVILTSSQDIAALDAASVRGLLDRVLLGQSPGLGLDSLLASGLLEAVLPEVHALVGFSDGEWRHKDVWKHTRQVLEQSVSRLTVRWAALLHDIGKVRTRTVGENGEVHFLGHAEVGARMFDRLARRQRWFVAERDLQDAIRFLISHHLRAGQYDGSWTDGAVRRFARDAGAHLDDLLSLSRADITTKRPEKRERGIAMIDELSRRICELAAQDAVIPRLPSGLGDDLMQAFGLPPSRHIGELKRALEAAIEAEEIESHREADYYVEFLRLHRSRFGV